MDYTALGNDATGLLQEFGQVVTFIAHDSGTYDMATGDTSGDSDAAGQSVYAVTVPWEDAFIDAQKFEWDHEFTTHYGTSILISTVRCLMSATDVNGAAVDVNLNDRIIIGGEEFSIKGKGPIKPAGINVLWDLAIRK